MALNQLEKAEIRFLILQELSEAMAEVYREKFNNSDADKTDFAKEFINELAASVHKKSMGAYNDLDKMQKETAAANEVASRLKPEW